MVLKLARPTLQPCNHANLLRRFLEINLLRALRGRGTIITPSDIGQRGCQLSILFPFDVADLQRALNKESVIVDVRKPNVIRVSPTPLYNTFSDVVEFANLLSTLLDALALPVDPTPAADSSTTM